MPVLSASRIYLGSSRLRRARLGASTVYPIREPGPGAAVWSGDQAGEFREPFLDLTHIDTVTGAVMSVNTPTKDASNPLLEVAGTNVATWDYQKLYVSPVFDGTTWHLFYGCHDDDAGTDDRAAYATSTDGLAFTKPNLATVTFDGSTANNLIGEWTLTSCRYYSALALWVATAEKQIGADGTTHIFTSTNPDTGWSLAKTITNPDTYTEGKELVRREDGRWIAYLTAGHGSNRRRIAAYLSATTDLDSDYSSLGTVLSGASTADQQYSIGVERIGELHYGLVTHYDATTGRTRLDLYLSRDGAVWSLTDADWIPVGSAGAFDDEMVYGTTRMVEEGNDWHVYYVGSPVVHGATRPKDMRIGRATIPKGRIGQVSGTGTVTTDVLHPTSGQTLSLNCDASGGSIEVEVLDAAGTTITGYGQAAAVDITTDSFATEPTWSGAATMPTGQDIKLRFHLATATLYGYEIT